MDTDAARELLALGAMLQRAADDIGVGRPQKAPPSASNEPRSEIEQFDDLVTSSPLRSASRKLFADGHYARSVEEAFKCLNNEVKAKSGRSKLDGDKLMRHVFSVKSAALALNDLESQSEEDEQRGYMDLFAGSMTGIRNPRAHEHHLEDDPDIALEMIVLANHLMRRLEASTKVK